MLGARGIGRIGTLAVGLGIGATWAHMPIASADTPSDAASTVDGLLSGVSPAAAPAASDFQISIDGMDLFPTAGNTATATSGMDDIAIAIGNGSTAEAGAGSAFGQDLSPGQFDFAVANGTDSFASAGLGNFDSAFADGTSSLAGVGGFNGLLSNGDFGAAVGNHTEAESGVFETVPSQNDVALVFDPSGTLGSTSLAGGGNGDLASIVGDNGSAYAGDVGGNFGGSNDIATILDPFGTMGDSVTAGASDTAPGNFDLAAVLLADNLTATATGANFLVDILPSL